MEQLIEIRKFVLMRITCLLKFIVAGIDLRFSIIGGPPFDEKLCDCVIFELAYDEGTIGVGTGAGNVGGGPGFGTLDPPLIISLLPVFEIRRYCFDCLYIIVSPNIRAGECSSRYDCILDGIDDSSSSSIKVLSKEESGVRSP